MDDVRKYNYMEETLKKINGDFISMSPDEIAENNVVLDEVLRNIINGCQETDDLFKKLYRNLFYGGSYYDGLKIGRPDEYDIDVTFVIPYEGPIDPSNINGFINLQLQPLDIKNPKWWSRKHRCYRPDYGVPGLHVLADFYDHYLDTEKVMLWMHRVLSTWIKGKKSNKSRISYITTDSYGIIKVKFRRHGPAFTFRTTGFPDGRIICFDLVPCFVFGAEQWPSSGFRRNPVPEKPEFFIIPKPLQVHKGTRYWRMSFQEQERVLLSDRDKLKSALRLIKKMRDKLSHNQIASYFIKTVFLWEVYEMRDDSFWNNSLSYVFMEVLKDYQQHIKNKEIGFFWYRRFNLLGHIDNKVLSNMSRELENIINHLENNPNNEVLVAKYLLSCREMKLFRKSLIQ